MEKKCKIIYLNKFIYILSDDEIKEGDWVIFLGNNTLRQVSSFCEDISLYIANSNDYIKKVIATTDTSLMFQDYFKDGRKAGLEGYPQPSQQFIDKYIESYNKGEIITDVLIEYEYKLCEPKCRNCNTNCLLGYKLKVNPKDNTITIKKLKDSWNREEVKENLIALGNILIHKYQSGNGVFNNDIDKWINENL